jgi:allophanate hydrolase
MTVQDASTVGNLIGIFDPLDAYSRKKPAGTEFVPESFQFAIPTEIEWFGDSEAPKAWKATLEKLQACGAHFSPVNFAPMHELAHLLYQNAWIAERTTAVGPFTEMHREDVHPIVAKIIAQGKNFSAVDMCNAEYRRAELALKINDIISGYTALLVPTAPRFPTVQEVLEEPVSINSQLGTYTNFVNLANCCALACPGVSGKTVFLLVLRSSLPPGTRKFSPRWHGTGKPYSPGLSALPVALLCAPHPPQQFSPKPA